MGMLVSTAWATLFGLLCYGVARLRFVRYTQYAHLPGPAPSLVWGHLNLIAKIIWPNPSKHFGMYSLTDVLTDDNFTIAMVLITGVFSEYGVHELIKHQPDNNGLSTANHPYVEEKYGKRRLFADSIAT
jgi:hypothetical protein